MQAADQADQIMPPNLHCCRFGSFISVWRLCVAGCVLIVALFATPKLYEGQQLYLNLRGALSLAWSPSATLVLLTAGLDLSVTRRNLS